MVPTVQRAVWAHVCLICSDDSPKRQLVLNYLAEQKKHLVLAVLLALLTEGKIKEQTRVLFLTRHHWFGDFVRYVYNWTNNNPGLKFNTLFC